MAASGRWRRQPWHCVLTTITPARPGLTEELCCCVCVVRTEAAPSQSEGVAAIRKVPPVDCSVRSWRHDPMLLRVEPSTSSAAIVSVRTDVQLFPLRITPSKRRRCGCRVRGCTDKMPSPTLSLVDDTLLRRSGLHFRENIRNSNVSVVDEGTADAVRHQKR